MNWTEVKETEEKKKLAIRSQHEKQDSMKSYQMIKNQSQSLSYWSCQITFRQIIFIAQNEIRSEYIIHIMLYQANHVTSKI